MKSSHIKNTELKVQIVNFGCKLNQFEGESLREVFIEKGIESQIVHPSELNNQNREKIIYIVNTCTVTAKSDRKARNAIYKAASLKREGDLLIVTGCYAQTDRDELAKINGVDFVVGNFEKFMIPNILEKGDNLKAERNNNRNISAFSYEDPIKTDRSRAYVKVQDGCDMKCSYCKVPLARGKSVSRPIDDVLNFVKKLEDNGYHEAVLTGINLGSYKYKDTTLEGLLEKVIENTSEIGIRLSSIEPMYFKSGLFDILSSDRIMPHFHIPLQSGSNRILKLMRRPYNTNDFISIIEKLRKVKKLPHLATDVIVGFPTESNEEFEESYRLINNLELSSIHVFTYSPRNGTEATKMKDDVSSREKISRSHELIELGKILNYKYRTNFLESSRYAIFEPHGENWFGVTDNYIKVKLPACIKQDLRRIKSLVRITKVTPTETYAELI